MSGFKSFAKSFRNGNNPAIILVNRATGAETTPSDCRSDSLYLKHEAQGFHANADGTVTVEGPPLAHSPPNSPGDIATFVVKAGVTYAYRIAKVRLTGTPMAAADIVLLYDPY